ncbi:MAG TPA: ATP-grasp domain-containing protein [Candidatus Babeliales bacterium]|nr:ATP-grasp domain-containing protein [Candidatus Babeliales bacterium]
MQKLRIGVLMGGKSLEKEVSFNSGRTICDHLDTTRYSIIPLFQTNSKIYLLPWRFLHRGKTTDFEHRLEKEAEYIAWDDLKNHVDFIYIAQHGRYAEDGTLQGFLEILGIPYLGSAVFASALRMDKIAQKTFLRRVGIITPHYIIVEPYKIEQFTYYKNIILEKLIAAKITTNYVIKPCNEGSSIGISIINTLDNLEAALRHACFIEQGKKKRVLIEEKIIGMEFTCIVLMDYTTGKFFALPPTEIVPEEGTTFFDYEQKYMPGRGIKRTPAHCSIDIIVRIQETCLAVTHALEFSTMSRIDGFVAADGTIIIIDPNTLSGMAPSSFIFNQAAEYGMSPSHVISHIIATELHQYGMLETIVDNEKRKSLTMHTQKIRVAILLGGKSNEKETSLDSGRNVYYKLSPHKYDPIAIFISDTLELYMLTQSQLVRNSTKEINELVTPSQKIKWDDLPTIADFVFIALHGGHGEDGSIQGALEILGMPYNGSSVLTSALCINKYKTNQFLVMHNFDVPKNIFITKQEWELYPNNDMYTKIIGTLQFPMIVKPHNDGCSVMVQKIMNSNDLITAINQVLEYKSAVLIEEYISGMELTIGIVGNENPRALPPSQTITTNGILSIEEKFLPGAGENQTPAQLSQSALEFIQKTVERVYTTVQCKGYARIDCFYQSDQQSPTGHERVIILEINTLPGLTPATCLFHQAAEIGLKPMDFIDKLITLGFEEHAPMDAVFKDQESNKIL